MNDEQQTLPRIDEDAISKLPALLLLAQLGYTYLSPREVTKLRGGKSSSVVLEPVLIEQLRQINTIRYKGSTYGFTDANIQSAVGKLKGWGGGVGGQEGLPVMNKGVHDLLMLGTSMQQLFEGDLKSYTLRYVDWENPANNVFHVAEEFHVDRSGGETGTLCPDIVLFVNGIPFCIIECKRSVDAADTAREPTAAAVGQHLRNQEDDGIPRLYQYAQLLLALSGDAGVYGAVKTPAKFWSAWREEGEGGLDEAALERAVNASVPVPLAKGLFEGRGQGRADLGRHIAGMSKGGGRSVTEQDRAVWCLCRPDRLLDLARRFTVFDKGDRKIARYQQYFTVLNLLERVQSRREEGKPGRVGGVVWHTQGSGKSLTMVMLARAIAMLDLDGSKVVLVTDRTDLDDQIRDTFKECGITIEQAETGADLARLLEGDRTRAVATVINKFQSAVNGKFLRNEGENIFVLVDEAHRTQYKALHASMQRALPNACFIGFTGTPVKRADRDTVDKFGGLVDPAYTIRRAVEDKAVVPLLYERRDVDQYVDQQGIDAWFDRITANLTREQATDLKKKFANAGTLTQAEQRVRMIAWDVARHFNDAVAPPLKGQLIAPNRRVAVMYQRFLNEFAELNPGAGVTTEVLITGPDEREESEELYEDPGEEVRRFWKRMMDRFGNAEAYQKSLINGFKNGEEPEIIIVVDKLTTGFDAPRNTVLYLCRKLGGHTLMQAIARVNRLYEGKDFGFVIDYAGVLGKLNEAMDLYASFSDFDAADIEGTVVDVRQEVERLPSAYDTLMGHFKGVPRKVDAEAYASFLRDEAIRHEFYEKLRDYAKCLSICLGSADFLTATPPQRLASYKETLRFFMQLRYAVRRRYAETVDFGEYEKRIQKLIDTHVGAGEVQTLTPLVNIFDEQAFAQAVEQVDGEGGSVASKADFIASQTRRTITERMEEDPAFYKKFSTMLEEAIALFKAQRISELEYLKTAEAVRAHVVGHTGDGAPESVRTSETARAYYGIVEQGFTGHVADGPTRKKLAADVAVKADAAVRGLLIVNWTSNNDRKNMMRTELEDLLLDLATAAGFKLPIADAESMAELILGVATRKLFK